MWSLISLALKTGADVYKDRRRSKALEAAAERRYFERMASGDIEYKKAVMDNQQAGWKDELVLIIIVLPIVILAWSVFSEDPQAQEKLDFYKWLVVGIFGAIYGLKPGIDLIRSNKK